MNDLDASLESVGPAPSATVAERPEDAESSQSIVLKSLAPHYEEEAHRLPFTLLRTALDPHCEGAGRPKNIALAGPYGSGKSSVLEQIVEDLPTRTVSISLSTVSVKDDAVDANAERHGDALPTTNFIQKEIVKQLLYREMPKSVPDSRFKRLEPADGPLAVAVAAGATFIGYVVAAASGFPPLLAEKIFAKELWAGWVLTAILLSLLGLVAWRVFVVLTRRFDVGAVSAGGATVTLTDRTAYYFDEFLDEIIYVFQRTKIDIVIFEDLDRFDDSHIYESLRSLNNLLNNSKQVGRPVQFVYAIRDSLFDSERREGISRRRVDEIGDRTKFFDLIVPLVPFVSDQNAMDLMKQAMGDVAHPPSSGVLELVAPHVPDMRLIHNIRNEYEVFSAQLLAHDSVLGGLNPQSLLAMVAYKNIAPLQFENIRRHNSELDAFFDQLRSGVSGKIAQDQGDIRRIRSESSPTPILDADAKRMGDKALLVLPIVVQQAWTSVGVRSMSDATGANVYQETELTSVAAWVALSASPGVQVVFTNGGSVALTRKDLEALVASPGYFDQMIREASAKQLESISKLELEVALLRRGSLPEMLNHPDLTLLVDGNQLTLRQIHSATIISGSRVLLELMRAGYVDQNYALYSARYYGRTLSAKAMTFVIQNIQTNTPDTFYSFKDDADADAIIAKHGNSLFDDEAGRNVALVSRLVATDSPLLQKVARNLSGGDGPSLNFILAVIETSDHRGGFFQALSKYWAGSLAFLLDLRGLTQDVQLDLFESFLVGTDEQRTPPSLTSEVLDTLGTRIDNLNILYTIVDEKRAQIIATQLSALQLEVSNLGRIRMPLRRQITATSAWRISASNIRVLVPDVGGPTLERFRGRKDETYEYLLAHLKEYLGALGEAPIADSVIGVPQLISDVVARDVAQLDDVLDSLASSIRLRSFDGIPQIAWRALLGRNLVELTGPNLIAYLAINGPEVDQPLANFLGRNDFSEKASLPEGAALALLSTTRLSENRRLALVRQTAAAEYDPLKIGETAAFALAALVGERLPDDNVTFLHAESLGVAVEVAAASRKFIDYFEASTVKRRTVGGLLSAPTVSVEKKQRVVSVWIARRGVSTDIGRAVIEFLDDSGRGPAAHQLLWLAGEESLHGDILRLLVQNVSRFETADVDSVLVKLEGIYADLTRPGGPIKTPKNDLHRALLTHLKNRGGVVTRWREAKNWITVYR